MVRVTEVYKSLLEGIIGDLNIGNYRFLVDDHFIQRTAERLIRPTDVDKILRKFDQVTADLSALDVGDPFWFVDKTLNVALAMRKKDEKTYIMKTVVWTERDPYSQGVDKYIYVH